MHYKNQRNFNFSRIKEDFLKYLTYKISYFLIIFLRKTQFTIYYTLKTTAHSLNAFKYFFFQTEIYSDKRETF